MYPWTVLCCDTWWNLTFQLYAQTFIFSLFKIYVNKKDTREYCNWHGDHVSLWRALQFGFISLKYLMSNMRHEEEAVEMQSWLFVGFLCFWSRYMCLKNPKCVFLWYLNTLKQQESPPAWTQEAYRPPRIKYSICYLRWGTSPTGVPSRPGLMGGALGGVSPSRGIPQPGPDRGYSPPGQTGGTRGGNPPSWTWPGYSPPTGVDRLKTLPSLILRIRSVNITATFIVLFDLNQICFRSLSGAFGKTNECE